jgi:crotonobetainyl-CoA:carnitine CoA-transferase CaiB-like acyl-CoA transferase
LLDQADVLVVNLRPGAAERLGLSGARLRERNPGIVDCQISAFGSSGPYAHRPGGDPLAGAYTGMQAAQGGPGDPVYVRGAPIDYTAALLATTGILLALIARTRTGRGQQVETSLLDAGALLNAPGLVRWRGRPERDDLATDQYRRNALVGLYEAADGWIALDVETDAEWVALVGALGEPGLGHDPRFADGPTRAVNDAVLTDVLGGRLRSRSVDDWVTILTDHDVPAAPVLGTKALTLRDPTVAANGWATEVIDPRLGPLRLAHRWLTFSRSTSGCSSAAPRLGGDNDRILVEAGTPAAVGDARP